MNVSSERRFSLLIPDLLGPKWEATGNAPPSRESYPHTGSHGRVCATQGAAPALLTLLARADRSVSTRDEALGSASLETTIFRLFDLSPSADRDLPVAAVARLGEGGVLDDNAWWLRADPVCLLPQGGGLLLQPGAELGLTLAQARALVDEILRVFAADGWHLEAPVAHRWYLRLANPPDVQTTPLAQVAA